MNAPGFLLEAFWLEAEDNYGYGIWLDVFSRLLKIWTSRKALFHHFSLEELALLSLLKEVIRFPDRKMIKLLTFDSLFPPLRSSRENSQ